MALLPQEASAIVGPMIQDGMAAMKKALDGLVTWAVPRVVDAARLDAVRQQRQLAEALKSALTGA